MDPITPRNPVRSRRNRVPKLSLRPDSSGRYYVAFRGAEGKPTRVRFARSRKDSLPQYRRWLRANYGRDRIETGELITITTPEQPVAATLKAIIAAYIAVEESRVRPDAAERTQGTVGIDQFWDIRYQALQIGLWAKEHFGHRFPSVELSKLMDICDYDAMMLHFIQARKYKKSRVNKMRRRFWDLVRFAKGRPFHQELSFGRDQVKRYGGAEKKREREIPSVEIIRKILAVANTEQRTRIWVAIGCAFGQDDLARCRPLHFDAESYDLRRGKTGIERYGTMRPMVWAHLQRFLVENPRQPDDLLFASRTGKPIVYKRAKTPSELKMGTVTHGPKKIPYVKCDSVRLDWDRLVERAGVDWHEGFYVWRHIGCTACAHRQGVTLAELWTYMGHGHTDTVNQYLKPLTPNIKATIEWLNRMLDQSDADAWKDEQVRMWEQQEQERQAQAKENSKRKKKPQTTEAS
jgi:hypothetical protein